MIINYIYRIGLIVILILLCVLIIGLGSSAVVIEKNTIKKYVQNQEAFFGCEITNMIECSSKEQQQIYFEFYKDFFSKKHAVLSKEEFNIFLYNAYVYDVPLDIAFSVAYYEDGLEGSGENVNTNGSIDVGHFGINNSNWGNQGKAYWLIPKNNIRRGCEILISNHGDTNNWFMALAQYNGGNLEHKRLDKIDVINIFKDYACRIMTLVQDLDYEFNMRF